MKELIDKLHKLKDDGLDIDDKDIDALCEVFSYSIREPLDVPIVAKKLSSILKTLNQQNET